MLSYIWLLLCLVSGGLSYRWGLLAAWWASAPQEEGSHSG